MNDGILVQNGIIIPFHEIEITASRSGGSGGQHVNKTDTKITIRWNIKQTSILNEEEKIRILQNLKNRLTENGDLIIHSQISRSQQQNKEYALQRLAQEIRKALYIQKKRMATRISKTAKELRLRAKTHRSTIKKMRSRKFED